MSSSRKRLRPLDPAEERSVTTSSWVRLSFLDDERSYCLSWPESPMTRFLSASTSYAATHIYHSHAETELCARMALSAGGATPTGRKPVPVPPVYRMSELSASTDERVAGQPDHVGHLLSPSNHPCPITSASLTQATDPHPLAPPRPPTTTEDSILSFTCTQIQDATEAGLLSPSCASGVTTSAEDCAKRRQLEFFVAGLEWRAFHESQRTGAALQRLLTLDAAVPLLPQAKSATHATTDDVEAQARMYELWLRWRLHSAGRLTHHELDWYAAAKHQTPPQSVESSLPQCAWGTPLLCGAYLYGMQNDYFLNPLVAPGTAALQQQQLQQQQNGEASASGEVLLPGSGHGGVDAGCGVGGQANAFMTRRRGCYNFLRWRIERYLLRLGAAAANGADGDGSGAEETRFGSARHNNAPLGAPQIDTLVRRVVLRDPVLDVEMDEDKDTLQSLAWTDLVEDCKSWSTWLSKV